MRTVLRGLAGIVVLLGAAGVALWLLIQPPAPMPLPPRGAVLDGVTLIEPGVSRAEHRRVVVEGATIASVEDATPSGDAYAGAYVLPGLADLHVHFPPATLPGQAELFSFLFLYHGVLAVRDAGDVDGSATEPARAGVAAERFPGPRIEACGPFVDAEPFRWKNSLAARDPDEGRKAVETLAARGFDCVKAYNELDAPTLAAIRDAARERGLPVIGHVPHRIPYDEARLDDAQHLIGIPPPTAPELQFPKGLVQWESLDDARLDALVAAMRTHGLANTPTLVTVDRLLHSQDLDALLREPDLQLLPRFYREVIWSPQGGTSVAGQLDAEGFAMVRRAFAAMQRTVKRLHDAGTRLHTGTDTLIAFVVPGASLHRELRLFVEAGLTPEEALAHSTRDSAAFLGVPRLGELRPGAPAELLVFREDPTKSLDALGSLLAVVRDGRLYTREALDAQLARYRAHFEGAVYDAVLTPVVRRAVAAATKR
jgi:hypothetical protein